MIFNVEKAINERYSVRSYENRKVEISLKDLIQNFIDTVDYPFNHEMDIVCFEAEHNKKLYTTFDSPIDNLAFISETDYISISKTGFVGELIILYMTSLNLGTCWMGHFLSSILEEKIELVGKPLDIKYGYAKDIVPGKRVICTTPVGYHKQSGLRLMDRVQKRMFSFKRKPIDEIVIGNTSDLSEDLKFALDLAGKAPSALNQQFWRFEFSNDNKNVTLAMPIGYKHMKWDHPNIDIGICACHFWLGLKLKGIESKVSVNLDQGRAVWSFELK